MGKYDYNYGMEKQTNINKAVSQHIEMENFWSGFSLKGKITEPAQESQQGSESAKEGLEKLYSEIDACRACALGSLRKNAVPGEGSSAAEIVFVGEGPGADEDAQGRPFVGRSGKLLTNMIKAMGLDRSDIYICNIVKCRPPENRDPKPEEISQCLPFLKQQLSLIRPQIIIALGGHAAKTLLETNDGIGRLRGRFHNYYFDENSEPIKLMPTYHPSYILRSYSNDNRRKVWEDLQKVMAEVGI